MKIGIGPYYIKEYGVLEGAKRMHRHGYEYLDFGFYSKTDNGLYPGDEAEFIRVAEGWRDALAQNGYRVHQIHGPWQWPITDGTEEGRAERFEKMSKALLGASIIGARYMAIHPIMPFGIEKHTEEEERLLWEMNVEYYSRLAKIGERYGVYVCLENMPFPNFPISSAIDIMKLVKMINHPYVRVCLDTGHANVVKPDPAESVKIIGKEYLKILHVHGNDGKDDRHFTPRQGGDTVNWEAFSAALREIDFDGVVSLETAPCTGDATDPEREEIEITLANIAKGIAGI